MEGKAASASVVEGLMSLRGAASTIINRKASVKEMSRRSMDQTQREGEDPPIKDKKRSSLYSNVETLQPDLISIDMNPPSAPVVTVDISTATEIERVAEDHAEDGRNAQELLVDVIKKIISKSKVKPKKSTEKKRRRSDVSEDSDTASSPSPELSEVQVKPKRKTRRKKKKKTKRKKKRKQKIRKVQKSYASSSVMEEDERSLVSERPTDAESKTGDFPEGEPPEESFAPIEEHPQLPKQPEKIIIVEPAIPLRKFIRQVPVLLYVLAGVLAVLLTIMFTLSTVSIHSSKSTSKKAAKFQEELAQVEENELNFNHTTSLQAEQMDRLLSALVLKRTDPDNFLHNFNMSVLVSSRFLDNLTLDQKLKMQILNVTRRAEQEIIENLRIVQHTNISSLARIENSKKYLHQRLNQTFVPVQTALESKLHNFSRSSANKYLSNFTRNAEKYKNSTTSLIIKLMELCPDLHRKLAIIINDSNETTLNLKTSDDILMLTLNDDIENKVDEASDLLSKSTSMLSVAVENLINKTLQIGEVIKGINFILDRKSQMRLTTTLLPSTTMLMNATTANATIDNTTAANDTIDNTTTVSTTVSNITIANATINNITITNTTKENVSATKANMLNVTTESSVGSNSTMNDATTTNPTITNAAMTIATMTNGTMTNVTVGNAKKSSRTSVKSITADPKMANATIANTAEAYTATSTVFPSNVSATASPLQFTTLPVKKKVMTTLTKKSTAPSLP